jgi:hypothetical protein
MNFINLSICGKADLILAFLYYNYYKISSLTAIVSILEYV